MMPRSNSGLTQCLGAITSKELSSANTITSGQRATSPQLSLSDSFVQVYVQLGLGGATE